MTYADRVPVTDISIHAPRGGSDTGNGSTIHTDNHFNPRSPWGERHVQGDSVF